MERNDAVIIRNVDKAASTLFIAASHNTVSLLTLKLSIQIKPTKCVTGIILQAAVNLQMFILVSHSFVDLECQVEVML